MINIYVSECGTSINLSPISDTDFYKVIPAIWHPAVYWPDGIIHKDDIEQLENIGLAFSDPFNVDAAIEYIRNRKLFKEKNKKILDIIQSKEFTKCSFCDENENIEFSCGKFHLLCSKCKSKMNFCPECRYENFDKILHKQYKISLK